VNALTSATKSSTKNSGAHSGSGRTVSSVPGPTGHTDLDFNSPLSDARAAKLIADLAVAPQDHVLDLGCGWAELLLRVAESELTCRATGIDAEADAVERGRRNASDRRLDDRVTLEVGDISTLEAVADVVIAVGVSHAWGGTQPMLTALKRLIRPGGKVLIGDGIWSCPPTDAALQALEAKADDFLSLAAMVDVAMAAGYRVLSVGEASVDEWDDFESRWCAGYERWLLANADHAEAPAARERVDDHRTRWLHGYRGVLGFAYLTLVAL
jgi:cyclopropane fatty-acyl-phospholipid synthase-like methyltransferase